MTAGIQSFISPLETEANNDEITTRKIQDRAIESDLKMVEQTIILLSEGGIKAVTLNAVGAQAGFSRGLVTRRYGSKEGLLIRVLNFLTQWVIDTLNNNKNVHGEAAILNSIHQTAYMIEVYPKRIRAYFWLWFYALESSSDAHEKLIKLQNSVFEQQMFMFEQAKALEEISPNADIEMMSDYIRTMMRGLIYSWMLDPKFNIVKRINEFADIHMRLMFKNSHVYNQTPYWGE